MNILYINHYAGGPKYGMEFRPYYLAKEWKKQGHKVTIIGADYSHLRTKQPDVKKDFTEEQIDGIKYIWLKTPKYKSSGVKRIINMLTFVYKLFRYKRRIAKLTYPNVVIASSTYPLDIYPAHKISQFNKAKLIFELHDMWPLSPMIIGGYSKNHPFIKIIQAAENYSCIHCNGYISLLGNAEEYLIEKGLKKGKFVHIPNGFYENDWKSETISMELPLEHYNLLNKLKAEGKIILGYSGGHAPSNALETLLEAAKNTNPNSLAYVLVGNGISKESLIKSAKKYNLNNIYFLPPVQKNEIPSLLQYFDFTIVVGLKNKLHYYGTSFNKVPDYMLAGKPIIFSIDEPNSIVEKVGCGIKTQAENIDEIVKAIEKLSTMSVESRTEMGNTGKEYASKELNYSTLAIKAIDAINKF